MQALISVSDKTGVLELAQGLHALGVDAAVHRRHRQAAGRCRPAGHRGGRPHRLSRDARRPRQDPAPARSTAACWRAAMCRPTWRRWPNTASPPSTCWSSTSIPFEATVAKPGCTLEDAIENIDIGGPAMVRSRGQELERRGGADRCRPVRRRAGRAARRAARSAAPPGSRWRWRPSTASRTTTRRSATTSRALQADGSRSAFPAQSNGRFVKLQDLRYGENPHQSAAFYRDLHPAPGSLVTATQLQGKELSYNNIADADAAWECVKGFDPADATAPPA